MELRWKGKRTNDSKEMDNLLSLLLQFFSSFLVNIQVIPMQSVFHFKTMRKRMRNMRTATELFIRSIAFRAHTHSHSASICMHTSTRVRVHDDIKKKKTKRNRKSYEI